MFTCLYFGGYPPPPLEGGGIHRDGLIRQGIKDFPSFLHFVPDFANHFIWHRPLPFPVSPEAGFQRGVDAEEGDGEARGPSFSHFPDHPFRVPPCGVVNEGGSFFYGLLEFLPGNLLTEKVHPGRILGIVSRKRGFNLIRVDHPMGGVAVLPGGAFAGGWRSDQKHRFFFCVVDEVVPLSLVVFPVGTIL